VKTKSEKSKGSFSISLKAFLYRCHTFTRGAAAEFSAGKLNNKIADQKHFSSLKKREKNRLDLGPML
jgi:hypothetical protein